ncbi:IclR family transcriptional regulator [Mycobacterium sp. URHB0044]|uniref:IclR family transcriptional regulator n=1 Tax=Mycobacterium sp. URHB0044 TaxID=1380386 RepID=UPI0018CC2CAF|nr:helix-turn-helix domain-containing protein [Mycobacterium sp. URHB0044]
MASAGNLGGRGVLEGAFQVLGVLAQSQVGVGLSEIARQAALPKSTTYRLLEQLVDLGVAQRHDRRYFVGPGLARLGNAWQPHPGLQGATRAPARTLSALTTTVVSISVLHEDRVRVVTATRGVVTDVPRMQPYDEIPPTHAGGLLLRLTQRGPNDEPPSGFTSSQWRQAHADFARPGNLVVDHQEVLAGVCCVAAPVRCPDGELIASISAISLTSSVPAGLPELVLKATREITRNLGRAGG